MYKWEEKYKKLRTPERREKLDISEEEKRLSEIQERLKELEQKKDIVTRELEKYAVKNNEKSEIYISKVRAMYEVSFRQESEGLETEKSKLEERIRKKVGNTEKVKQNYKKIDNILEYINKLKSQKQEVDKELEIRNLVEGLTKKIENDQMIINNNLKIIEEKKLYVKNLLKKNSKSNYDDKEKIKSEKTKAEKEEKEARKKFEKAQDDILKNALMLEKIDLRDGKYKDKDIQELESINMNLLGQISKCNFICKSMVDGEGFEESIKKIKNRSGKKQEQFHDENSDEIEQHNDFVTYIREIAENGLTNTQRKIKETQYKRAKEMAYEREKIKFGKEYAERSFHFSENENRLPIENYALKNYGNIER